MVQACASHQLLNTQNSHLQCRKDLIASDIVVGIAAVAGVVASVAAFKLNGLTLSGSLVLIGAVGLSVVAAGACVKLIEKTKDCFPSELAEKIRKFVGEIIGVASVTAVPFYLTNLACSQFASLGSLSLVGYVASGVTMIVSPFLFGFVTLYLFCRPDFGRQITGSMP